MNRRYAHAVLGHLDGAEELVGFGRTPAAALRDAREIQTYTGAMGPLRTVPIDTPFVQDMLRAIEDPN